jgi:tetratricopeptide (TPR) repeat protein
MLAQGTKIYWRRLGGAALAMVVAGVAGVTGLPPDAAAQRRIDGGTYENCMRRARADPDQGLETALAWQERGGGVAARHCAAVSLIGLGQHAQAARRLAALAGDMRDAGAADRAAILAQAGNAWIQAGDYPRAHTTLTAALALSSDDAEILTDRAIISAGMKQYWDAIDDLNRVVGADPDNVAARILRASAYRLVDVPELAREDAAAAFRQAPERPEVLLEYGIILRLAGDRDGARRHWANLIRLHDGAPAAEVARRNLARLNLPTE